MLLRMLRIILFTFALLLVPAGAVLAHLDAGEDKVTGAYLIDFGYAPAPVVALQPTDLALNLVDNVTQTVVAPARVWVRIADGDAIVFSGNFIPQANHITFSYAFPHAAEYDILAEFFDHADDDEPVVSQTFTISVAAAVADSYTGVTLVDPIEEGTPPSDTELGRIRGPVVLLTLGLIIVVFLLLLLRSSRRTTSTPSKPPVDRHSL